MSKACRFFGYWLRAFKAGRASRMEDYSLMATAAQQGKFMRPSQKPTSPLHGIVYALHFDASLFAAYLRRYAEARGVRRTEGIVGKVNLDPQTGFVEGLELGKRRGDRSGSLHRL